MEIMPEKDYSLTVKTTFSTMLLCFAIMVLGCNSELEVEEGILGKDTFVEIMVDVQLLESAYKNKVFRNDNEDEVVETAYISIFEKYGVTAEEFRASHTWWWSRPEEVKSILIQVTERLNALEEEMSPAIP